MKINVDSENESPPVALTPSSNHNYTNNTTAMTLNSSSRQSFSSSAMTALSPKTTNIIQHQPSLVHSHPLSLGGGDQHDEIFQLQIEIQSLKNRLKQASSAQKHELLELLQEKDTVIQTKSKQISTLNEKFLKITKAVAQMEREVEILRKDKEVLEDDHKKLKRHLNIREKEVTALVTRCTAQEDKLAEMKSSRILEKQLQEVQAKLEQSERQVRDMEELGRELVQSNREREIVMHKYEKVKEENDLLEKHLLDTKEQLEGQLKSKDESLIKVREQVEELTLSRDQKDEQCRKVGKTVEELKQRIADMEVSAQNVRQEHELEMARLLEQMSQEAKKHKDFAESISSTKDQVIESLKLQIRQGEEAMTSVLKNVNALKHENETLQKTVKDLNTERNRMVENLSNEKQSSQETVERLKSELDVTVKEASELNDALCKIQTQQEEHLIEASKMEEKISSLLDQIEQLHSREKVLTVDKQKMSDQNISLSHEMEEMKRHIADMKKVHQEQLASAEADKQSLKEACDDMLLKVEEEFKVQDKKYESERTKVEKLRVDIEQITTQAARQEELRIKETKLLEDSIKAAKMQLDAKERELAAKNENLLEERCKVTDLEATVKVLERSSQKNEIDATAVIEELSSKINEGTARYAKLEEEKDNIVKESRKAIAKLQEKITSLETEFTDLKDEIVKKDSQLEKRQSTIKSLQTEKDELEKKIRYYHDELTMLIASYDETKEEYTNSLNKLKAEREKDNALLVAEYNQLKTSASKTESELENVIKMNQGLKDLVAQKAQTIGDLETITEELKKDNNDKDVIISDLENKYNSEKNKGDEFKRRISQINAEKEKEINTHVNAFEKERSLRLDLQNELEDAQMVSIQFKEKTKECEELKAENYLLKDKIDRQTAFMTKKLENEKKKRGYNIPNTNVNANPNMKSPPRPSSSSSAARSRSLTRKSVDAPRLGLGAPRNRARSTSVGPISSMEPPELQKSASDELDELLGNFNEI